MTSVMRMTIFDGHHVFEMRNVSRRVWQDGNDDALFRETILPPPRFGMKVMIIPGRPPPQEHHMAYFEVGKISGVWVIGTVNAVFPPKGHALADFEIELVPVSDEVLAKYKLLSEVGNG